MNVKRSEWKKYTQHISGWELESISKKEIQKIQPMREALAGFLHVLEFLIFKNGQGRKV